MRTNYFASLLACLFVSQTFFAQNSPEKEKIVESVSNYFYMDRENIHVHLDKKTFMVDETIWFKGYVYNKKSNTPFLETTNVYALLYDSQGVELHEKLLFAYGGAFSGNFKISPDLPSGQYHLHFYTNYMNNFAEDESVQYTINIVNPQNAFVIDETAVGQKIKLEVFPEGGQLISGVANNVAIKVTDCNGLPTKAKEAQVQNGSGKIISTVVLDRFGIGKMYVTPTGEVLKAVASVDGKTHEAFFPPTEKNGIALEINNYALAGKTLLKFRASSEYVKPDAKYLIVIQQNDKTNIFDLSIKQPQTEMVISNENFFPGTNSVRIITSDLRQIAERSVFYFSEYHKAAIAVERKQNGTFKISGSNGSKSNLSIAVFPVNSKAAYETSDLKSAMMIDSYFAQRSENIAQLLSEPTKANKFQLDLFMLTRPASKYLWANMLGTAPKLTYDFDIGLAIKGNVGRSFGDPKSYRIKLRSTKSYLTDYSEIDSKGEFVFKNLVFANDSELLFNLLKNPSTPQNFNLFQQIQNRKRGYRRGFKPPIAACERPLRNLDLADIPVFGADVVQLDEISVKAASKKTLKYSQNFGNAALRGVKVTDENNRTDLLTFLSFQGFNISRNRGNVDILTRNITTTLQGQPSRPVVYVNGRQVLTFDELLDIHMMDVDEIYYDINALVPSMNNFVGIIKIYLRRPDQLDSRSVTKLVTVPLAFATIDEYEPPKYIQTDSKGFNELGIINWIPNVITDDSGKFELEFYSMGKDAIKVIVEGMTTDGKLIHEEKIFQQ